MSTPRSSARSAASRRTLKSACCWLMRTAIWTGISLAADRRGSPAGLDAEQLGRELPHAPVDVVADPAHRLEVLAGRVLELPVEVALAREDRAGVAATHR